MNNFQKPKNITHYLALLGIFLVGFLAFWIFSWDRFFQIGVSIAVAVSYVVWGIIHHYFQKDLCFEIIVEYISIAALGVVVLLSLIFTS